MDTTRWSESKMISLQTSPGYQPDKELVGPVSTTDVVVSGRSCQALLDTGSQVTTITDDFILSHPELKQQF